MSRLQTFVSNLPNIIWAFVLGLLEWIVPRDYYAKDVSSDIALVTGAGSGLGRGICLELSKLGCSLILWDINAEGLQETKSLVEHEFQSLNKTDQNGVGEKFCFTYIVDVSKRTNIQEAAKKVQNDLDERSKGLDRHVSILVNNAGIYDGAYLHDLTDTQIEKIFHINILAHFWTVRAFLPKMIEHRRGHILEIASFAGLSGSMKQVAYSSTKYATVGFEESLSAELDNLGHADYIKTTTVCPLFFKSNLWTGVDQRHTDVMSSSFVAKEAVFSMRCNHSRVCVPRYSYLLLIIKNFSSRQSMIAWSKALGFDRGLKEVQGNA